MRKIPHKSQMRNILQNSWPVLYDYQDLQNKESLEPW